jgi:hypothetical protein
MVEHTMITAQELMRRSRAIRDLFLICRLMATHQLCILKVIWPLAPRKSVICLQNLCNEHIPIMSGCLLILAQNTCRMTHLLTRFNSLQMRSRAFCRIWMSLGPEPWNLDGIPPIILKNSAFAFAKPLSLSYVTPVFKKGRRNNVEDYRGMAILSAIPKQFELLVYRRMCNNLKNLMSIIQHGFMKNRSTITNLLEHASFVLNSIEDGNPGESRK